jgi:hypothetical protein
MNSRVSVASLTLLCLITLTVSLPVEFAMPDADVDDGFRFVAVDDIQSSARHEAVKLGRTGSLAQTNTVSSPVLPKIPIPPNCNQADLALVIDGSGSVGSNWGKQIQFAADLVNTLPVSAGGMHVSIVVFSSKSSSRQRIVQRLTGSKATLMSALKNLRHDRGGTYMVPAVRNAKSALSSGRVGVPKVMLMLTDGRPSDRPSSEFHSLKAAGIKVMMVLIGKNIRRSTVQSWVSSPSSDNAIAITSGFAALKSAVSTIVKTVCTIVSKAVNVKAATKPALVAKHFSVSNTRPPKSVFVAKPVAVSDTRPSKPLIKTNLHTGSLLRTGSLRRTKGTGSLRRTTSKIEHARTVSSTRMRSPNKPISAKSHLEVGQFHPDNKNGLNHKKTAHVFRHAFQTAPAVIAGVVSMNGGHPVVPEVASISKTSMTMVLNEPSCYDQWHTLESADWLAVGEGLHTTDQGALFEVGSQTLKGGDWKEVKFSRALSASPTVVPSINDKPSQWTNLRIKDVSRTGFKIHLEAEKPGQEYPADASVKISWIAIPQGTGTISGMKYYAAVTAATITEKWTRVSFPKMTQPRIFAGVTHNGPHTANLRLKDQTDSSVLLRMVEPEKCGFDGKHPGKESAHMLVIGAIAAPTKPTNKPTTTITSSPLVVFTSAPKKLSTTSTPIKPAWITMPPFSWPKPAMKLRPTIPPQTGPCKNAGHLHLDFGGDVTKFSDREENSLHDKLCKALNLKKHELKVTRHAVDEAGLNLGAVGNGKLWHPTKVQLNFRFVGTDAIKHGYELERQVESGKFVLGGILKPFPLLRLQMEEIYCTKAPTGQPTISPTNRNTHVPTEFPTAEPTLNPTWIPTAKPSRVPTAEPTVKPTVTPTEEPTTLPPTSNKPTFAPSATPTEEPTAKPTATPTSEPTAKPTRVPTAKPTAEPTARPTEEPTVQPTDMPTTLPTIEPSELPSFAPTHAPTGCLVRGAKMHILFKEDAGPGRRLLMQVEVDHKMLLAVGLEDDDGKPNKGRAYAYGTSKKSAMKGHTAGHIKAMQAIQAAVAKELHLSIAQLAVKSYPMKGNTMHTELQFKGNESIKLGRKLEKAVLANKFNPVPGYPIQRLYMEEIFDCGKHAAGATHRFNTNNHGPVDFTLPDAGWQPSAGKQ